ncbi:hypothetical protein SNE40_009200 [Patella caerulea]|uniref:Uncharacterized protein n=1 Tax=Patella caerulea TaxID=87958 RepID=A0AAN8JP45_PATCE
MDLQVTFLIVFSIALFSGNEGGIPAVTLVQLLEEELYKTLQACENHEDCSCVDGVAVCYGGCCHCIYSRFRCKKSINCSDACPNDRSMCLLDRCHCVTEQAAQLIALENDNQNDTQSRLEDILSQLPQRIHTIPVISVKPAKNESQNKPMKTNDVIEKPHFLDMK